MLSALRSDGVRHPEGCILHRKNKVWPYQGIPVSNTGKFQRIRNATSLTKSSQPKFDSPMCLSLNLKGPALGQEGSSVSVPDTLTPVGTASQSGLGHLLQRYLTHIIFPLPPASSPLCGNSRGEFHTAVHLMRPNDQTAHRLSSLPESDMARDASWVI